MRKRLMIGLGLLAVGAGAAPPNPFPADKGGNLARLGQIITVDGPRVQPLKVLEDSRCAPTVQCIWAGRVRLLVLVYVGRRPQKKELTLLQPIDVADGRLELTEVWPQKNLERPISPKAYRFRFSFAGGL